MTTSQHRNPKAFPYKSLPKKEFQEVEKQRGKDTSAFLTRTPAGTLSSFPVPPRTAASKSLPAVRPPRPAPRDASSPSPPRLPHRRRRHHTGGTRGAASLSLSLGTCEAGGSQPSTSCDASHIVPSYGPTGALWDTASRPGCFPSRSRCIADPAPAALHHPAPARPTGGARCTTLRDG